MGIEKSHNPRRDDLCCGFRNFAELSLEESGNVLHYSRMVAKRQLLLTTLLAGLVFCLAGVADLSAADSDSDAIAAKAQALSAEINDRSGRIIKMHQFVQDEIRETKTTYG